MHFVIATIAAYDIVLFSIQNFNIIRCRIFAAAGLRTPELGATNRHDLNAVLPCVGFVFNIPARAAIVGRPLFKNVLAPFSCDLEACILTVGGAVLILVELHAILNSVIIDIDNS